MKEYKLPRKLYDELWAVINPGKDVLQEMWFRGEFAFMRGKDDPQEPEENVTLSTFLALQKRVDSMHEAVSYLSTHSGSRMGNLMKRVEKLERIVADQDEHVWSCVSLSQFDNLNTRLAIIETGFSNPVHKAAAELVEEVEAIKSNQARENLSAAVDAILQNKVAEAVNPYLKPAKRTMTGWEWRKSPGVKFRYAGDTTDTYAWVQVGVKGYLQLILTSSVSGKEIRANTGFLESEATEV